MEQPAKREWRQGAFLPGVLFCGLALSLALFKFSICFSQTLIPFWDLPAHGAITQRLQEELLSGRFRFLDPAWLSGWPAFSFYAPGAHILAAVFGFIFQGLGIANSGAFAVQTLIGLALIFLPWTMFYCVSSLQQHTASNRRWLVLFFSIPLTLWFLRHPARNFGLGASAGIELGLFPQVLTWHAFLYFLAFTWRCLNGEGKGRGFSIRLSLAVATLALFHTLTFLVGISIGLALCIWQGRGRRVLASYGAGLMISAFWFLPALVYGGALSPQDRMQAQGSLFTLLTPFPWQQSGFVNLLPPMILLGILFAGSSFPRNCPAAEPQDNTVSMLSCIGVICVLGFVLPSDYFGLSFPGSMHLYRLLPLFLLALIWAGLGSLLHKSTIQATSPAFGFGAILFASLTAALQWDSFDVSSKNALSSAEGEQIFESLRIEAKKIPQGQLARVFIEHLGRPDRLDMNAPHLLSSQLWQQTGLETVGGLFVQSSLTQAFPAFSAKRLKMHAYNARLPIGLLEKNDETLLRQRLADFGVQFLLKEKRPHGREFYQLERLQEESASLIERATKPVVGYQSDGEGMPYLRFEQFFYGNDPLWKAATLIEIAPQQEVPPQVSMIVQSDSRGDPGIWIEQRGGIPNLRFSVGLPARENGRSTILWESAERTVAWEQGILNHALRLPEKILEKLPVSSQTHRPPEFPNSMFPQQSSVAATFDRKKQSLFVRGLIPGELYRVNFSALPFWRSDQATLYRGDAERLWFLPKVSEIEIQYRPEWMVWSVIGSLITLLGLCLHLRRPFARHFPKRASTS